MTTPIPRILIALDGKIAFLKATNPWGGSETKEDKPMPKADANAAILGFLKGASKG